MTNEDFQGLKFFKVALASTFMTGEMTFPRRFSNYLNQIPSRGKFVLRDGHEWEITICKERKSVLGLKPILKFFQCNKGAFFFMQYKGEGQFMCDVFPLIRGSPQETVEVDFLGRYIMKIVTSHGHNFDDMVLPPLVLAQFKSHIPNTLRLRLKNGVEYVAKYEKEKRAISGFKQLQQSIEIEFGDTIVVSCDIYPTYHVALFGTDGIEKNPASCETNEDLPVKTFEITVRPSHLQKYSQGVLVPAKYQNITASWQAFQFIEVTDGLNKWKIEVKKRNNMTELHRGWEVLWKDMKLKAGDTCVFESLGSNFKFNLRVFYRIR